MCGGGGGILGGISKAIFGSTKAPEIEVNGAEATAAPAASRKEDTGAIVHVGASTSARTSGSGTKRRSTSMGGLGSSSGLSI